MVRFRVCEYPQTGSGSNRFRSGSVRVIPVAHPYKYLSLYERWPELFKHSSKSTFGDQAAVRCSYSSDMSIDDDPPSTAAPTATSASQAPPVTFPLRPAGKDEAVKKEDIGGGGVEEPLAQTAPQPSSRRLSVQDRINMFENKQKEVGSATGSGGKPPSAVVKPDLRRLSSDVSSNATILRRWSGASDMSVDLSGEKKETDSPKPPSIEFTKSQSFEVKKSQPDFKDQVSTTTNSIQPDSEIKKSQPDFEIKKSQLDFEIKKSQPKTETSSVRPEESVGSNQPASTLEKTQSFVSNQEEFGSGPAGPAGPVEPDSKPTSLKAPSKRVGSGSKMQEAVAASQHRGFEIGSLRAQTRPNSSTEAKEPIVKQSGESRPQKTKAQKNVDEHSKTPPPGKFFQVGSGSGSGSAPLETNVDQVNKSRPVKGNQELNDELKLKANELEKLFAEHKLRAPKLPEEPVPEPKTEPKSKPDDQNHQTPLQRSFSDASRGKSYNSYVKKREERLKEQWGSNKAEKEARMKAMQDSLEESSAQMKTKLSWSAGTPDPVSTARRRAERLRSFNSRSAIKREQPLDFGQVEDEEDITEFSDLKISNNGVSRGKKPLPKNSSTSTPRTIVPRTGSKLASGSGKRRAQSENPLAQSVPNFSDLRKEDAKPYSIASKAAARSQMRNHTRSRSSTNDEAPPVKEEKPTRAPPGEGVNKKPFHKRNNSVGAKMKVPLVVKENEFDDVENEFDDVMETEACQDIVNESLSNSESGNGQTDPTDPADPTDPNLTTEILTAQDLPGESPMSWNSQIHYPFSYTNETSDNDASVESWNLSSTESDVARMRKKWGSAQKNILVANSSSGFQSRKDMTKGFKRLLKFGRKGRGSDNLADWVSATTSEGDDDTEDGRDVSNRSSDEIRKSRMGYGNEGGFNEADFYTDQMHTLQTSIPTPPANFRLRDDHLSGSSMKAPRSFFSLSSFRSKGSDSKLR